MKLLIQTAMIFFGTLLFAAVVALGEPVTPDVAFVRSANPPVHPQSARRASMPWWMATVSARTAFGLR
jgi:hypothetical protein